MKSLKKLFALILIGCLSISLLTGCLNGPKKYVPSDEKYFEFIELDDGTYAVSLKADAVIPEGEPLKLPVEYNEEAVTAVADNGFKESSVKSVQIPKNIKVIGETAFYGCEQLSSVYFGGVREIQSGAFYGCSAIEKLDLPRSLRVIGDSAFTSTSIIGLVLPDGVETVGNFAFAYCARLDSVSISYTVSSLAENAFKGSNEEKIEFEISASNDYYKLVDGKPAKK
jgi:hypothetical protein